MATQSVQSHFDKNWNSSKFNAVFSAFASLSRLNQDDIQANSIGDDWFLGNISESEAIRFLESRGVW